MRIRLLFCAYLLIGWITSQCKSAPDLREDFAAQKREHAEWQTKYDEEMRQKIAPLPDSPTAMEVMLVLYRIDTPVAIDYAVTPQNHRIVEDILLRLAMGTLPDTPPIPASLDGRMTAIEALGRIGTDTAILPALKPYFARMDREGWRIENYPYRSLVEDRYYPNLTNDNLRRLSSSAMTAYGQVAKRTIGEDAVLPEILPFFRNPGPTQGAAWVAVKGYRSPALVGVVVQILREIEARFPVPWQHFDGTNDKVPSNAPKVASEAYRVMRSLIEIDTPQAKTEAETILTRWEAKYRDDPQWDWVNKDLCIWGHRLHLPIPETDLGSENGVPETMQVANAAPGAKPTTGTESARVAVATESTPSIGFLWTCAAAAISLLVGLVVFWKRRPS